MTDSPPLRRNSRPNLDRLLGEMVERPDAFATLAEEIDRDFGEVRAVMVLDMTGFARTVQRRGITAFLLMIHQMKRLAGPVVVANGGVVIKAEADNLFSLFATPADAVAAARDIVRTLDAANAVLAEDSRLYASIGIGYGRILNVDEDDIFGDEVNLASKLGEDIAGKGEILLTAAAHAALEPGAVATREETISLSGLSLGYHALV